MVRKVLRIRGKPLLVHGFRLLELSGAEDNDRHKLLATSVQHQLQNQSRNCIKASKELLTKPSTLKLLIIHAFHINKIVRQCWRGWRGQNLGPKQSISIAWHCVWLSRVNPLGRRFATTKLAGGGA